MKLKQLGILSSAILLTFTAAQVSAQDNAIVTFTGAIANATCDISTSQKNIDLGTHAAKSVTDITEALETKSFNLTLNNCSDASTDPAGVPLIVVTAGNTLAGHADLFADEKATQIGVKLTAADGSAGKVVLKANDRTSLDNVKFTGTGDYSLAVDAALFATATTTALQPQVVNVPVTFSVAYN